MLAYLELIYFLKLQVFEFFYLNQKLNILAYVLSILIM